MSDILQKILATKREEIDAGLKAVSLAEMQARAREQAPARDFVGAVRAVLDWRSRKLEIIAPE